MGRKLNRGKEKKLKKKEEEAKIAEMWAIIDAANNLRDPMETMQPFKSFSRNGIDVKISCERVTDMDKQTIDAAFNITKQNMQTLYQCSEWGWNDDEKRKEMTDKKAWYLVVRQEALPPSDVPSEIVAIVHFRFDMEDESRVVYCYEIQLTDGVRRKGLGKFLMQILELIAFKTNMQKVMVTVFRHNRDAQTFFIDKLKYQEDETSPVLTVADAVYEDFEGTSYQILSKTIKTSSNAVASSAASVRQTS